MRLVSSLLLSIVVCGSAHAASVVRFSPEGKTKTIQEVSARFSEPMIALGDAEAESPFDEDCAFSGGGRWVDPTTWKFEFVQPLPPGARCTFHLREDLHTLSGATVDAHAPWVVETTGLSARLLNQWPATGEQVFVIGFNARVDPQDALKAVRCELDGKPLGVAQAPTAQALAMPDTAKELGQDIKDWGREMQDNSPARYVVLQCPGTLAEGKSGALVLNKNLRGRDGVQLEREQRLPFKTREPLHMSVQCTEARGGACKPDREITVRFNRELSPEDAAAVRLRLPDGTIVEPTTYYRSRDTFTFAKLFPQLAALHVELPALVTAALRAANGGKPVADIKTSARITEWLVPPTVGVVPAGPAPRLPLAVPHDLVGMRHTVRMLRIDGRDDAALRRAIDTLDSAQSWSMADLLAGSSTRPTMVPLPQADRHEWHLTGIPLPGKGLYVLEWPSHRPATSSGSKGGVVSTAALVTDLSIHLRVTREAQLVWVTSLATGQPVAGADVQTQGPDGPWHAATDANGLVHIPFSYKEPIVVRKDDDLAFVPVGNTWNGVEEQMRHGDRESRIYATVFDTTLLQPGATVHMKHLRRIGTSAGLAFLPADAKDDAQGEAEVTISHYRSRRTYTSKVAWTRGQAQQDWPLPADAPLGEYEVSVDGHVTGSFRVEAFDPPQTSASVAGPRRLHPGSTDRSVVLTVTQLNGGPGYGEAVMRTVATPSDYPYGVGFPAYPDIRFGNGVPRTGLSKFPSNPVRTVARVKLDRYGQARFELPTVQPAVPHVLEAQPLEVEFDFPDANGQARSVREHVDLLPAAELLGVAIDEEEDDAGAHAVAAVAVDADGRPLAGRSVRLTSAAVRDDVLSETDICTGKTDAEGRLRCSVKAPERGAIIVVAHGQAADGRALAAFGSVHGRSRFASETSMLALAPPRRVLAPGATARIGLANVWSKGWMLVTVEREGFLSAQVLPLDGAIAHLDHIDLPLTPAHAPNVKVHVLQERGYEGSPNNAMLEQDGSVDVSVKPDAQALRVAVHADRDVYRPGQQANVTVAVTAADGQPLPPHAEVAVAVVDAGVLELRGNGYWNLLARMMRQRYPSSAALDYAGRLIIGDDAYLDILEQASSLNVVVTGAQHRMMPAPLAAAPAPAPGQQGGQSRIDFKPQVLWRASVPLDANGRATVPVRLNDALSRFRIVAVAQAGADRFGDGGTDVLTRQALELRPQLPAVARAGDRVGARALVRNTSTHAIDGTISGTMRYPDGAVVMLPAHRVALAPGASREEHWDVKLADSARGSLAWTLRVQAGDDSDQVQVAQDVVATERPRVLQAALVQLDHPVGLPVRLPDNASGGQLDVSLSATLDGGLAGVRAFFERYPYDCFEQRLSRAATLGDRARWDAFVNDIDRYVDHRAHLLRYFPNADEAGSDVLTSYVLDLGRATGFSLPQPVETELLDELARGANAAVDPDEPDAVFRRVAALAVLAQYGKADAGMIDKIAPRLDQWPVATLVDWMIALRHEARPAPKHADLLAQASNQLRARLIVQGRGLDLASAELEQRPWLMFTADLSLARLLVAVTGLPEWRQDLAPLAHALMQRQRDGHWTTTVANAWGAVAMHRFAAVSGGTAVDGTTRVTVNAAQHGLAWNAGAPTGHFPLNPGANALAIEHAGAGAPWAALQVSATAPLREGRFNGIRIHKTVTPLEQKVPGRWSRGDLVQVQIEAETRTDLQWVVLDDPVPPGAVVQGSGLGGDTTLAGAGVVGGENVYRWSGEYRERKPEALRVYRRLLPGGTWHIAYTMRLNTDGEFRLPATHAEAMYQPEVSGDLPNAEWSVE